MALSTGSKGEKAEKPQDADNVSAQDNASVDSAASTPEYHDPYADLDVASTADLRKLAEANDVRIPEDVERSYLITELRAARSRGTLNEKPER